MIGLSFVTLLSYDWRHAFAAIRSYYSIADEIILGIDRDRLSWSQKPFAFDDRTFAAFVAEIDHAGKIRIVEGNYHSSESAMANDTAERRELGLACRSGNWVVQIDSDEILLNPADFKQFLQGLENDVCVAGEWQTVYKIIGDKALVVAGGYETPAIATRSPHRYTQCRVTDQQQVLSPLRMLHLSWGRTEAELFQKLTNWSHCEDIDVAAAMELWKSITMENYFLRRDLHPMYGPTWPTLQAIDWDPAILTARDPAAIISMRMREVPRTRIFLGGKNSTGGVFISFNKPP